MLDPMKGNLRGISSAGRWVTDAQMEQIINAASKSGEYLGQAREALRTASEVAATAKAAAEKAVNFFEEGRNLIDPDKIVTGYYQSGAGTPVASELYSLSDYIPVTAGASYWYSLPNVTPIDLVHPYNLCRFITFFDANKTALSAIEYAREFTVPDGASYVRLSMNSTGITNTAAYGTPGLFAGAFTGIAVNAHPYSHELKTPVNGANLSDQSVTAAKIGPDILQSGKNLLDKDACDSGLLMEFATTLYENADYLTSGYIPVKAGQSYAISPYQRFYAFYDRNRDMLTRVNSETIGTTVVTPEQDGFLRVTFLTTYLPKLQVEVGNEATAYEPYKKVLAPGIAFSPEQIAYLQSMFVPDLQSLFASNVLYKKKWVACGDSFTVGGSSGRFTEGPYAGLQISYPYFIGMRNNTTIVNKAVGGMTLTRLDGRTNDFSTSLYQTIDADADYITLQFGINDRNYSAPVGTIDDTTNATFYGAWNVVLEHIIVNHPTAKIGIIVTNGSTLPYVNATIAIAEKWGIPYLNMATGVLVPTMLRSNKTLPASVVTARTNAFAVDPETDTHPNALAHEYESTFIEHFLRSL